MAEQLRQDQQNNMTHTVEPLADPFLVDYLDDFEVKYELLIRSINERQAIDDLARDLCERSRDVMFRIWPTRETPEDLVGKAIRLFHLAAEAIQRTTPNGVTVDFAENMTKREEKLAKSLDNDREKRPRYLEATKVG